MHEDQMLFCLLLCASDNVSSPRDRTQEGIFSHAMVTAW